MRRILAATLCLAVGIGVLDAVAADGRSRPETLSSCQRISHPGRYEVTTDLGGAPVALSDPAQLAGGNYTGNRSLDTTCFEIAASGVHLDCLGHQLTGDGGRSPASAGIVISGTSDAPLSDVRVENCTISAHQFGLYAGHLAKGLLADNQIKRNAGTGMYLEAPSHVRVADNTVARNDPDGILTLNGDHVTLAGNVVYYNRARGITFDFGCSSCAVRGNTAFSQGILGFAIYAVWGLTLEHNVAHDNRYHGFAILHEAGGATFRANESYANDATGFFLKATHDNRFTGNYSHDNGRDGVILLEGSAPNAFSGNRLTDNSGYGMFSDEPIDPSTVAGNVFSRNTLGPTGNRRLTSRDYCFYTGFGPLGECDPVFLGGPDLKDPAALEPVLAGAHVVGDPRYYPSMGDLWMSTWAPDDRLFLSWGDGTGFADGYPTTYPDYLNGPSVKVTCDRTYLVGDPDYFPHGLWCNVFRPDPNDPQPRAPLTDAGLAVAAGPVPDFTDIQNVAIDTPGGEPFFVTGPGGSLDVSPSGVNDKPSSLLYADGRLYLAGHSPAGNPITGYIAVSDDDGHSFIRMPGSPWGSMSNFRVLMFINRGRGHRFDRDGYAYALGIGSEAYWPSRSVYLARVPETAISDYGAYEYLAGLPGGLPRWSPNESDAIALPGLHTVGQASAMYHLGTGRYLMLTATAKDDPDHHGALFEAPQPWGPWTRAAQLCFDPVCQEPADNPAWTDIKYIPGLVPKGAGPDHVYFTIAGGDEHYQLQIGKLVLDPK